MLVKEVFSGDHREIVLHTLLYSTIYLLYKPCEGLIFSLGSIRANYRYPFAANW
jgi:hypothetical protein